MTQIRLETFINAPIERVFDLARSIDLHKYSTKGTKEEAIAGKMSGLIELNETVTWRAKHLGLYQNLTVQITRFERPNVFADKMLAGAFSSLEHTHQFQSVENGTNMIDLLEFSSPLGFLGELANFIFLRKYMTNFLVNKNRVLKTVAESEAWKQILPTNYAL